MVEWIGLGKVRLAAVKRSCEALQWTVGGVVFHSDSTSSSSDDDTKEQTPILTIASQVIIAKSNYTWLVESISDVERIIRAIKSSDCCAFRNCELAKDFSEMKEDSARLEMFPEFLFSYPLELLPARFSVSEASSSIVSLSITATALLHKSEASKILIEQRLKNDFCRLLNQAAKLMQKLPGSSFETLTFSGINLESSLPLFSAVFPVNSSEHSSVITDLRAELNGHCLADSKFPLFYKGHSLEVQARISKTRLASGLIDRIHSHVKSPKPFSECKGSYLYFHYGIGKLDDRGWGCAYRSLQTILSWYLFKGYLDVEEIPDIRGIQRILYDQDDRPESFLHSKEWIGAVDISIALGFFNLPAIVRPYSCSDELDSAAEVLASHFDQVGSPVMVGGGVLSHTIVGVSIDSTSSKKVKYLVADPHYYGPEDVTTIIDKKGCAWRTSSQLWTKGAFYNMCLPKLPKT